MRIVVYLLVIALVLVTDVCGKKKKWLKHPSIVVLTKNTGDVKEIPTEGFAEKKSHHNNQHSKSGSDKTHHRRLNFGKTDALPYTSPYSRPYNWNMYTDGPYGWGPGRRRRDINRISKRSQYPWPRNYARPQYNRQPYQPAQPAAYHQPAQPASYVQPARRPYNYQAAQSRNSLTQSSTMYSRRPMAQSLQRKAPQVQQPQERTWVDKMGIKWTTRKVNDYKWGEREPGVMMDQYAGGPFGFDDVKRSKIQRTQWEKRSRIPGTNTRPRSWIDKYGVRWTNQKVNDYKWGEREPGVAMDQYNGGPFGWNDVKRNKIFFPNRPRK